MCGFGDCNNEGLLPIVITVKSRDPQERPRFCCYAHAIGWLLEQAERYGGIEDSARLAIQGIVRVNASDLFGRNWERTFWGSIRT